MIPASLSRAEEAEWVETMVARLERSEQRRRPSDEALLPRAHGAQRPLPRRAGRRRQSVRWVENQQSRWGSCTPGDRTIRLSARLQGMPRWVIDYVLVHELAHLLEPGHDARFWAWVDRYPQAERAKGYLLGLVGRGQAGAAAGLRRRLSRPGSGEALPGDRDQRRACPARARAGRRPATSARRATPR